MLLVASVTVFVTQKMSKLVPFLLLIAVATVVRGDDVCSICACESGKTFPVLIDCQKMKLQTLFREWSLPESFVARNDIMFDVDLAENDVEVVDVDVDVDVDVNGNV